MKQNLPDFVKFEERYNAVLNNGQRAELRRAAEPSDLAMLPSYYHLIGPKGRANDSWYRFVYFLPYVRHKDDAPSFGSLLPQNDRIEKRIFHIVRSQYPNDLINLRRLVQQIKPTVDWRIFGKTLFYWNEVSKKQLIQDYFIVGNKEKTTS